MRNGRRRLDNKTNMWRSCGLTESVLLSQKYESELPGGQILKEDEVSYIVLPCPRGESLRVCSGSLIFPRP